MITLVIFLCLALYVCSGLYKGFIWNFAVLSSSLISCVLAFALMIPLANLIRSNESIDDAMLSYTEGAEHIYDVELRKLTVDEITAEQLDDIMEKTDLVFPFGQRVRKNIELKRFENEGITTLGEYFNESMVRVIINIISFLLIYLVCRVISTFLICWYDYTFKFKKLRKFDWLVGGGIGLLRGILGLSIIFMLIPIVLTVLDFDVIREMFEENIFASFFHKSNLLLRLIPGK